MIPNVGPAASLLGSWLMAAVEHREAIAHKAPSRQRASLLVLLTLAAAYAMPPEVVAAAKETMAGK